MIRPRAIVAVATTAIAVGILVSLTWTVLEQIIEWPDPEPWMQGIVYRGEAVGIDEPGEGTLVLLRGKVVGRVEPVETHDGELVAGGGQVRTFAPSNTQGTFPIVVGRKVKLPSDSVFVLREIGERPTIVVTPGTARNLQPGERLRVTGEPGEPR